MGCNEYRLIHLIRPPGHLICLWMVRLMCAHLPSLVIIQKSVLEGVISRLSLRFLPQSLSRSALQKSDDHRFQSLIEKAVLVNLKMNAGLPSLFGRVLSGVSVCLYL